MMKMSQKFEFDTEKGTVYKYCIEFERRKNNIKAARSLEKSLSDYSEICEIGAQVEMKWSAEDLAGTGFKAGQ